MTIGGISLPVELIAQLGLLGALLGLLVRLYFKADASAWRSFDDFGNCTALITLGWSALIVAAVLVQHGYVWIEIREDGSAMFFISLACCTRWLAVTLWRTWTTPRTSALALGGSAS